MSVFTKLPQDMLQWEIARFLDHRDVLAFNEVLHRNERVYKKLPADFALKNHLLAIIQKYQSIKSRARRAMSHCRLCSRGGRRPSRASLRAFVISYKEFFAFLADPMNQLIFNYQRGFKDRQWEVLDYLRNAAEDEEEFFPFLHPEQVNEFQYAANKAWIVINETPFVRDIPLSRKAQAIF